MSRALIAGLLALAAIPAFPQSTIEIVRDGRPLATIVVAADAPEQVATAAQNQGPNDYAFFDDVSFQQIITD